jgi:ABC-type glutathione transport system ATPase component
VALVGESGSGKSVTALSILKLLPYPARIIPSGSILFKGKDLIAPSSDEMREVRGNDITMVFQEPMTSLNPLHTHRAAGRRDPQAASPCRQARRAGPHARTADAGRHPDAEERLAPIRTSSPAASASA